MKRLVLVIACVTATLLTPLVALAQMPPATEHAMIRIPPNPAGEDLGTITVFVNGVECATVDVTGGEAIVELGAPGQPAACAEADTPVTFVGGDGRQLAQTDVARAGSTIVLTDFAPSPADRTIIRIPLHDVADQVRTITIFVDGTNCGTVDITGGPATIELGTADKPAACGAPGGEITFVDANGRRLHEKYALELGRTFVLTNLAPEPPTTGDAVAPTPPGGGAPTAGVPTTGGAPAPARTGAGPDDDHGISVGLAALGAAALAIMGGAAVWSTRRRAL